jgi:beta-barrel assembly-enhancing protease
MPTSWTGYYLDGHTAARQRITATPSPCGIEIAGDEGWARRWSYDEIELIQGAYAGEPVRLGKRHSAETLVIASNSILTAIHQHARSSHPHIHDPKSRPQRLRLTVMAGIAVVCLTVGLYRWGIPAFSAAIASYIPVSWEQHVGAEVVAHFATEERRCADPYRTQLVRSILSELVESAPPSPYDFKLYLVDNPTVNALAAPGGQIVVFRGLLERTESAEQLAGVLAHEIQHVLKRHSTRLLTEQILSGALLTAVSGDFSSAMTYGLQSVQFLGQLQYGQAYETQADEEGMKLIIKAGLDPKDMIAFYRIMGDDHPEESGVLAYLSSHPLIGQRITHLEQLAGQTFVDRLRLEVRPCCLPQRRPPTQLII